MFNVVTRKELEPITGTHFKIMIGCYNDIDTNHSTKIILARILSAEILLLLKL